MGAPLLPRGRLSTRTMAAPGPSAADAHDKQSDRAAAAGV
jgi:hypothetical protein